MKLPTRLQRFLSRDIDSIGTLELLFLLAGQSDRRWTLEAIVQHMRSTELAIMSRLKVLDHLKLVIKQSDEWQYHADAARDAIVRETMIAYRERRVRVIEAIYARSTASYREFADAFRLLGYEENE